MLNKTAVAFKIFCHNCDWTVSTSGYIKGVTAAAAKNLNRYIFICTGDKEGIISFHSVKAHLFYTAVPDRKTRAIDTRIRDYKIITKLGTHNCQGIKAVTALNIDRGIDRVLYKVSTLPAVNICYWSFWVIGIYFNKSPYPESIIILLSVEEDLCQTAVYCK